VKVELTGIKRNRAASFELAKLQITMFNALPINYKITRCLVKGCEEDKIG
jgi:hypothetical protein